MKILFSVDPEIPVPPKLYGGIERIVDALITELRARGHAVGLAANPDSECTTDFFQPWLRSTSGGFLASIQNSWALVRAVRAFGPDLVHSFSRLGYLLPLLPTRLPKLMSYQRHTGGRRNRIATMAGGKSFAFTACSEFIAGQGQQWGGRWHVVPNFVDTERYTFVPFVGGDAPLVFLSRVERIKGAHTAIEIARRAGRSLVIAGNRITKGDGAVYWEREIAPHIQQNGIDYIGPVNDAEKNELLGKAAALIVPIEWDEPFGIVFIEALACGTPVISCPRGALPEIVGDGNCGFLVNGVIDGIAAVQKLSGISRKKCRDRAEQHFSASVVTTLYEQLYRKMVTRAR